MKTPFLFPRLGLYLGFCLGLVLTAPIVLAQEGEAPPGPEQEAVAGDSAAAEAPDLAGNTAGLPGNTAQLIFGGQQINTIPFTRMSRGPLFDLATMARILDIELAIGPLGNSHRLTLREKADAAAGDQEPPKARKEVLVGPDLAVMVITQGEGSRPESINFSQPPVQLAGGIRVPLDFFELAFGEDLRFDFNWDDEAQLLYVQRRESRTLDVSIEVIHQLSTTVEIRFDALPRYRVERLPDALEIRLTGDRFAPVNTAGLRSPYVDSLAVFGNRLRINLTENADVAEPRLLESGEILLIVEAFRRSTPREAPAGSTRQRASRAPSVRTIVIDPGHGGEAAGAVGRAGTTEKDLALTVSRSLRRVLESRLPVQVVLTRDRDEDLPHEARTAIANQNKADLFISIHFNSYYGRRATGAETYFLSREASDKVAGDLAAKENESGAAASPESDLQLILWDLAQSHHLSESQRFASLVQEELNQTLGLRNRGVKQAPFRVLMGAAMPAVLVELGFISNPEEETRLNNPAHQAELVESLYRAVYRFKTQIEAKAEDDRESRR